MGIMTTTHRKRTQECMNFPHFQSHQIPQSPIPSISHTKRPKLSPSIIPTPTPATRPLSTATTATGNRISRYPEPKGPFRREVHAPCRPNKFVFSGSRVARVTAYSQRNDEHIGGDGMGSFLARSYGIVKQAVYDFTGKGKKEVVELDADERGQDEASEDLSVREVENVEIGGDGRSLVADKRWIRSDAVVVEVPEVEFVDARVGDGGKSTSTVVDSELTNSGLKMVANDAAGMGLAALIREHEQNPENVHLYKKLLLAAGRRDDKLGWLSFEIELNEKKIAGFELLRPKKAEPVEEVPREPFLALTEEEEDEVASAFSANRRKILVTHDESNIEISGEKFQCLRPGAWLNDEVINLYLELLKEREKRDPQRFLKCHFFNTFFYKKLISGRSGYDFKSVRRWTSQRKLGYGLIECDKIFVPIHKEIHWCLAIINKKDQKFQYLDSLKGMDNQVLKVLARYYVDEVKDKTGKDLDVSSWEKEFVEDLPEQENGYDCGVFMIKYADFYSRGLGLCFNQEHMPYFRQRTAKEILRLRAE
ncbi:ubiquitin-like-specific protease ESD4 isoform X1 [Arachis stenosperma]|uniref:ubiquitin-like-specific protease ESD4 isoform X1 n=1 Tax=Arachis stenosperma TaxID=217475 RepID=UPI0025ABA791|nr:ubiquitin-like-specific protease ESD4 isoform X1 [Arachis stenosperma]